MIMKKKQYHKDNTENPMTKQDMEQKRKTRTSEGEIRCFGSVSISCSACDTRRELI